MNPTDPETIAINGINAVTGGYLVPTGTQELTIKTLSKLARKEKLTPDHKQELADRLHQKEDTKGLAEGLDAKKLSDTGWGIIFASVDPDVAAIREALAPLLTLRKQQVNNDALYKEFTGHLAYRQDETKLEFLSRNGSGPGPVNPKEGVPYYLLIVGSPELIPYTFQYQLDVQFAVGRIWFATSQEYDYYARSVVAAEMGKVILPRRATFFGVRNPDDRATHMSADYLIKPLAEDMSTSGYLQDPDWQFTTVLAEAATRDRLSRIMGGDDAEQAAFTMVASHGMGFPNGHPLQLRHQGALLCQDWTGPYAWKGPIPEELYFAGDHIADSARLQGTIAFFFACYGAGTPRWDDFTRQAYGDTVPAEIAPHAFLAQLPQRMLSHPRGGALAVAGHIERAWGYSFMWGRAGKQLEVFRSTLKRLMDGYPIGAAIEYFNQRYAEIASELTGWQDKKFKFGVQPTPSEQQELAGLWTANHDARNYAILGDPAVRLPVGKVGVTASDISIEPIPSILSNTTTPPPTAPSPTIAPIADEPSGDNHMDDWMHGEPTAFGVVAGGESDSSGDDSSGSGGGDGSGGSVDERLERIETRLDKLDTTLTKLLDIVQQLSKRL